MDCNKLYFWHLEESCHKTTQNQQVEVFFKKRDFVKSAVTFAKFLRTPFSLGTSERLLMTTRTDQFDF